MSRARTTKAERKLAQELAELSYDRFCRDVSGYEAGILAQSAGEGALVQHVERDEWHLPAIEVPLGDIAYHDHPERLPVIGVQTPALYDTSGRYGLNAFMAEHHAKPFFRPVFLLSGMELLPLLGRYGFAYHVIFGNQTDDAYTYLQERYDMSSVRELVGATLIWSRPGN